MIYIGIDQSYTSTGFVVIDHNDNILDAKIISSIKDELIFKKAWDLSETIKNELLKWDNPLVAIEGLAFSMTGNATRDLAGLQFLIISKLMFQANINPAIIAPPSLKKSATGNGKASKEDMIAALPENVYLYFINDLKLKKSKGLTDMTDAYFLAKHIKNSK